MKPKLLTTLRDYSSSLFWADMIGGITVAIVALPLSIAIAIASGAPPAAGLVTAVIGGFLISALGGSRVQIGGPTGAFIVVVFGVIEQHGYDGLVLATLMAGVILVIAALMRAGRFISLIPETVIEGFTVGIAVIIAISQLKDILGLAVAKVPADIVPKVETLWAARGSVNPAAVAMAVCAIILIVAIRRLAPRFPGLIVAVAIVSVAVVIFALPVDTIASRYGALPRGLPMPTFPTVTVALLGELMPSAFVIAFLAGIESLLSAIVADRMIGSTHRSNAELMAQGCANIGSSLFGGLPATGAIARTATNVRAGSKTPVAGLVHALVILAIMAVAGPLVGFFAMPALAGLLLITAWNMSEPHRWGERMRLQLPDKLLFLLTLVLTVFSDLTVAIAVGTVIGLGQRLVRNHAAPEDWSPPER